MKYLFNVFGQKMSVRREDQQWVLYSEPDIGIGRKVYDVVIPSDLQETQLATYLDDIYHELATESQPSVVLIKSSATK